MRKLGLILAASSLGNVVVAPRPLLIEAESENDREPVPSHVEAVHRPEPRRCKSAGHLPIGGTQNGQICYYCRTETGTCTVGPFKDTSDEAVLAWNLQETLRNDTPSDIYHRFQAEMKRDRRMKRNKGHVS